MRSDDALIPRLGTRPSATTSGAWASGTRRLGLARGRDAWVHVPEGLPPDRVPGLLVHLHGAGGSAASTLAGPAAAVAAGAGAVLLVPESRGRTWDVILGGFGPDAAFLDAALAAVASAGPIDPARVVLAGFSDGASYALSLGLLHPELFPALVAFSPGFLAVTPRGNAQRVLITHGTADRVLPIERCSRRIVPELERAGIVTDYLEFDGGHEVPPAAVARASRFMREPHTA